MKKFWNAIRLGACAPWLFRAEPKNCSCSTLSSPRTRLSGFCLIAIVAQAGCATSGRQFPYASEAERAQMRNVAVVSASFVPQGDFKALTTAAQAAESTTKVPEAQRTIDTALANLQIQQAVHHRAIEYARRHTALNFLSVTGMGPAAPDDRPQYAATRVQPADTLLEISVTKIGMQPRTILSSAEMKLHFTARARLIRTADAQVLSEQTYNFATPLRTVSAWMTDNGRTLRAELEQGLQSLAEQIVDRMFLYPREIMAETRDNSAHTGDNAGSTTNTGANAPTTRRHGPAYTLQPKTPDVRDRVDSLQPTLVWESFPRSRDLAALAVSSRQPESNPTTARGQPDGSLVRAKADFANRADAGAAVANVRYDIRLYEAVVNDAYWIPGKLIYERADLAEPRHRIDFGLVSCSAYFWTIRARFDLNSRPRAIPWAGTYAPERVTPLTGPEQAAGIAVGVPLFILLYWPVLPFLPIMAAAAPPLPPPEYPYLFTTPCGNEPRKSSASDAMQHATVTLAPVSNKDPTME